jgi:hypothetical protein
LKRNSIKGYSISLPERNGHDRESLRRPSDWHPMIVALYDHAVNRKVNRWLFQL